MRKARSEGLRVRYETKIEEVDRQLREFEKESETKKLPDIQEALMLVFRFIGTPAETWVKASPEAKIILHNMIFTQNPEYSLATGFGTPSLSLPFRIKEHISDSDGNMVDLTGIEPATSSVQARRSSQLSYRPTADFTLLLCFLCSWNLLIPTEKKLAKTIFQRQTISQH